MLLGTHSTGCDSQASARDTVYEPAGSVAFG